jgi:hypothetical protein
MYNALSYELVASYVSSDVRGEEGRVPGVAGSVAPALLRHPKSGAAARPGHALAGRARPTDRAPGPRVDTLSRWGLCMLGICGILAVAPLVRLWKQRSWRRIWREHGIDPD